MKVSFEESQKIKNEYLELRNRGFTKSEARDKLSVKFNRGLTTIFDHTSDDLNTSDAKILLFDIETAPNLAYVWRHWQQDVLSHEKEWYILSFSAKWLGNSNIISRSLPDYPDYKPNSDDDKALVADLWQLFNEADILVGHNLDDFDVKRTNTRFVTHGFDAPSPYKTVDTKKMARKYFSFNSNRLDNLGQSLGLGRKLKHTGFDLWLGCLAGEQASWDLMRKYNRQDVILLEKVYLKLRTWATDHPNVSVISEIDGGCRNCGSTDLRQEGYKITPTGKSPSYQCNDCGAWNSGKHQKLTNIR